MLTILEPLQLLRRHFEVSNAFLQTVQYSFYTSFQIKVFSFNRTTFFAASNGAPASASPLAGKLFVVLGAGGAGKALAYGGYEKGARVIVANRTYGGNLWLVYIILIILQLVCI